MAENVKYITNVTGNCGIFDKIYFTEIIGADFNNMTYSRIEMYGKKLEDVLHNLRNGNPYNIQIADMLRKGDRKYTARLYQIPIVMVMETVNYEDAREMGLHNGNYSILMQKDGQGCLLINRKAVMTIERLFVIKHEIMDGTMPFYYDRRGNKTSELSFNYDMFFSDSKQAMDKQTHLYDGCAHVEKLFIDYRFDSRCVCN